MTYHVTPAYERRAALFKAGAVSSIRQLEAMLPTATPVEAEAIHARIANRRHHSAQSKAKRRARERDAPDLAARHRYTANRSARLMARTPEQAAEDQTAAYPSGRHTCRDCGHTLSVRDFAPAPHQPGGIQNYCTVCWNPGA